MSILRDLLGWLVEPASERSTQARHKRRTDIERAAIIERNERKREIAREKKEQREERTAQLKERAADLRLRREELKAARESLKHNPKHRKNPKDEAGGLGRLDAADKRALETAQRMSQIFHGTPDQVVELDAEERRLPRFAVVVGDAKRIAYEAPAESKRAGIIWEHESGDRGEGKPRSAKAPLLLVDPETRTVFTVKNKSPMRFSSKQGIIG